MVYPDASTGSLLLSVSRCVTRRSTVRVYSWYDDPALLDHRTRDGAVRCRLFDSTPLRKRLVFRASKMPIYKMSMIEHRWGAIFQKICEPVFRD